MTPEQFISTWTSSDLNEKSGAQTHFNGLCDMLGVPKPTGTSLADGYGFEVNVDKVGGGRGYADAWKRGCFAWEYKSPGGDLRDALKQLKLYASDLENPPLLIVSDMRRIELHTNWTSMVQESHALELDQLADVRLRQKLKWAFDEATVEQLKPSRSANATTEEVAKQFVQLAQNLRDRGHDPEKVAHFVNRMVFCMFAEDVDLLPKKMFERMLKASLDDPENFVRNAQSLFAAMAKKGGLVGFDAIDWFNGGLFENDEALPLTRADIKVALEAADKNWSEINPSIMGTLFERGLDPSKRSQLGAHYTDAAKIDMIVRPVIIEPLLREWAEARAEIEAKLAQAKAAKSASAKTKSKNEAETLRIVFLERLKNFRVLDPACGSGNFLYVALKALKDIEARVNIEAESLGLQPQSPSVGPECVKGIEINPFAAELARVSVWIGEIQWMREKGFGVSKNPILKSLDTIECRDALLNPDGTEAEWPEADVIIGNPPFVTTRDMIPELGLEYVGQLRSTYSGRVVDEADFVSYWFEKASGSIVDGVAERAGLVSTNSLPRGRSRVVLDDICSHHRVFDAWSDEEWVPAAKARGKDFAAVRVSITCFGNAVDAAASLNGKPVSMIGPDLMPRVANQGFQVELVQRIEQNIGRANQGIIPRSEVKAATKKKLKLPEASFLVEENTATKLFEPAGNPNGNPNSDVLKRYLIGEDIVDREGCRFLVDFTGLTESQSALYQAPFKQLSPVRAHRAAMNQPEALAKWWLPWNNRDRLRQGISSLERFLATPRNSKHRVFVFSDSRCLPDCEIVAVCRDDWTTFGVLHSNSHELWALRNGSFYGVGNTPRYSHKATFETFPFPEGLTPNISAADYANDPRAVAIAKAAARLNELRENWLNPPDLVMRVPEVVPGYPDRILPVDDKAASILKNRTLTKLYNERPAWLDHAHRDLDAAVAAAYGWPTDLTDEQILEKLFALNQERAAAQSPNAKSKD